MVYSSANFGNDHIYLLLIDLGALLAAVLIFIATNHSRLAQTWNKFFTPPHSLKYFFRQTLAGMFSRWWILAVPLALTISSNMDLKLVILMQIKLNPEILAEQQKLCKEYSKPSRHSMNDLKPYLLASLASSASSSLSSPITMEEGLPLGTISFVASSIALLVSIIFFLQRKSKGMQTTEKIISLILIGSLLLVIAVVMDMINQTWRITPNNPNSISFFEPYLIYMGIAAIETLWFAAIYLAGTSTAGDFSIINSRSGKKPVFDLILQTFPVFLAFYLLSSLFSVPWSMFITPHHYRTDSIFYQIIDSKFLTIILAWCFYPLPFLAAKHGLNLRTIFPLLLKTWRHHFIKLLSLALIVVAVTVLGGFVLQYYKFTLPHPAHTLEQCMEGLKIDIDIWAMLINTARVIFNTALLMLMVKVFSSDALEVPKEDVVPSPQQEISK